MRREIGLCDDCIEYLRAEIAQAPPRPYVEETITEAMLARLEGGSMVPPSRRLDKLPATVQYVGNYRGIEIAIGHV